MMKKTLILASLLALTISTAVFAEDDTKALTVTTTVNQETTQQPDFEKQKPKMENQFEKRLKLTDEQKQQAKEIRMKSRQEIEPIMEQIKAKRDELRALRGSETDVQSRSEQINSLRRELHELQKKAHEIRMNNMKEFEAILTKKQIKELNKIKAEGRKKFEQEHKNGPRPFGPPPGGMGGHMPQELQTDAE